MYRLDNFLTNFSLKFYCLSCKLCQICGFFFYVIEKRFPGLQSRKLDDFRASPYFERVTGRVHIMFDIIFGDDGARVGYAGLSARFVETEEGRKLGATEAEERV